MHRFTTGMIAGSVLAAVGIGYMMKDQRACKKIVKKGKKIVSRAENMVDGIVDDMR